MDSQGTVAKPVSPTPPGSHGACDLEGIEATGFATDGQSTGENHVRSRIPATPKPVIPLLPYQLEDFESADRFRWNCWARQTGKSFTKSLRRIVRGLRRRRNQIFLSAGERQSRELMIKARQHCQALKIEFQALEDFSRHLNVQKMEIVLPGRVRIIGLPANPQTARGYTGDVLLDEFAMHAEDREIWAAIFPSLLRGDGELDIASTPRGHGNMFYHLRDNRMFAKSMISLPEAIAQGLDVDAEEVRRAIGDEELYRQEFLCEFLDEATAFLTYEQIGACVDKSLVPYATPMALGEDARELFVGVDIGRTHDLTAIWVLAKEKAEPRVDGAVGRKPIVGTGELHGHASVGHATQGGRGSDQLVTVGLWTLANAPFREQFDLLSELLSIRTVRRCCIDAGGLGMQLAEQTVERFGAHRVVPVQFTPALKSQIAGGLRIAVEGRRIVIPQDERVVRDWHSVERAVSAAGHFRLAAPRGEGGHADRFWAAALAVHAEGEGASAAECHTVAPLVYAREGAW